MKLLEEIIELLSSDKPDLNNALFKTKVLMHRMAQDRAQDWVNSEINGYSDSAEVPSYRTQFVTIMANVSNGYTRHSDMPITVAHLDTEIRETLETCHLRQSIAVIERYAENEDDLIIPIDPFFNKMLAKTFSSGFHIERAWRKPSSGTMIQVVNEVRSKLLDFVLELSVSFPDEIKTEELKEKSIEEGVEGMFKNAIFGSNTTIVVGDNNAQSVSNSIVTNDFDSLSRFLKSHSVSDEDVEDLELSIAKDKNSPNHQSQDYGENVQNWYQSMLDKAASLAWDVNTGVAGSLLAAALNSYYGWI